MTREVVRRNTEDPRQRTTHGMYYWKSHWLRSQSDTTYRSSFSFIISPFWLSNLAQVKGNWDDHPTQINQEAMKGATVKEILAYLMPLSLSTVYQGPTQLIKRMVLNKNNTRTGQTMDPARSLQLITQLDNNIEALLVRIYSTWSTFQA